MASGRLGAVKPGVATYKTLYKPGVGVIATVNMAFCNQTAVADTFRLAIVQASGSDPTPAAGEFIAYDAAIPAKSDSAFGDRGMFGPYILNGNNNDQLVGYSANGGVSFVVTGDEGAV